MSEKISRTTTHAAFRFVVDIDNAPQAAFMECTLPTIEWEVEELKEGGLNSFTHQLPGRRKGARITLKNGVGRNGLVTWTLKTMGGEFVRKSITVKLLDSKLTPVMSWHLQGAYPVKWSGPQLRTTENTVAIQTLELVCSEIAVSL